MGKIDNLRSSYEQAKLKRDAIMANSEALSKKKENIDKQLEANQIKLQKLNFFLAKTLETLEGKNT